MFITVGGLGAEVRDSLTFPSPHSGFEPGIHPLYYSRDSQVTCEDNEMPGLGFQVEQMNIIKLKQERQTYRYGVIGIHSGCSKACRDQIYLP